MSHDELPKSPNRRQVLGGLTMGAAALATGACKNKDADADTGSSAMPEDPRTDAPSAPWTGDGTPDPIRFDLGVQSADPLPDGAVFWTHYTASATLQLVVATWDGSAWQSGAAIEVQAVDGYVHQDVRGLPSDTPFAYQFRDSEGAFSDIGAGRTAIEPEHTGRVRFGASSCLNEDHGEFPSLEQIDLIGPMDFFLWAGDMVYTGSSTLEGYRSDWVVNLPKTSVRAVLAHVPGIYTWDDHEVANNWDPTTIEPARQAAATQAFYEHAPRRLDQGNTSKIWRSMRFGMAVEVFVLDCRGERNLPIGQYISPEQLAWLKQGLTDSPCTWKVILNSVAITNMPVAWDVADVHLDRWEGYPEQRAELLDHITDSNLTGILFITGDMHHTSLMRVEPEGPRQNIWELMAGPAGSDLNPAGRFIEDENQFPFSDADWSATWFECSVNGSCRVIVVHESGVKMLDTTLFADGTLGELEIVHPYSLE